MADVIKAVCWKLNNDAEFQAAVGPNKANTKFKAYAGICPQPEKHPYAVVRLLSKLPWQCKEGRSGTYNGSFAVHCFHTNYETLVQIVDAVDDALDQVSGVVNTYSFKKITYANQQDAEYAKDYEIHQRVVIFDFVSNEDTTT